MDPIDGGDVRLRAWEPADAAWVEPMRGDPQIGRWSGLPGERTDAWIARQAAKRSYAIVDAVDGRGLGKVALTDRGAGVAELGYWLLPEARGRGVATRACRALADHGFTALGLKTIVLEIDTDNPASLAVARRLAARVVEEGRAEADRNGVPRPLVRFELRPT
jgi:RimJ/RimL family protein N-acetyltransferase